MTDLNAVLLRLAEIAESADYWTEDGKTRLMPAAGVADVVYDALEALEAREAEGG
jgi:hypothetical protein